jgi:hypothetical protein
MTIHRCLGAQGVFSATALLRAAKHTPVSPFGLLADKNKDAKCVRNFEAEDARLLNCSRDHD